MLLEDVRRERERGMEGRNGPPHGAAIMGHTSWLKLDSCASSPKVLWDPHCVPGIAWRKLLQECLETPTE